jgi:hypothetical protein
VKVKWVYSITFEVDSGLLESDEADLENHIRDEYHGENIVIIGQERISK